MPYRQNEIINPMILNAILENTSQGICLIWPDGTIAYINPGFAKMIGCEAEQLLQMKIGDLLDESGREFFINNRSLREQGKLSYKQELNYINPNTGQVISTWVAVNPILDSDGKLIYSLGIHSDVTEFKKVKHALDQNLTRLSQAQKKARLGFWDFNVKTQEYWWSEELLHLCGLDDSDSYPTVQRLRERIHLEDREKWAQARKGAIEDGQPYTVRVRFQHATKGIMHLMIGGEVERDETGKIVQIHGIVVDETRKVKQERLIESQKEKILATAKLSALGEMAGGIAHEINNPLAIIKLRVSQLMNRINSRDPDPDEIQKCISQIDGTVDRIAKIVKSLKIIGRDGSSDPFQSAHLPELIENSVALCGEKFSSRGIRFEVDKIPALNLSVRVVEISQILLNLLNNAHDAVENLEEKWIRLSFNQTVNSVEISVINSGPPIPPSLHEKIFQPFFTTKEIGKGTGLGLSISKALAELHGGKLELRTASASTEFTLILPKLQVDVAS